VNFITKNLIYPAFPYKSLAIRGKTVFLALILYVPLATIPYVYSTEKKQLTVGTIIASTLHVRAKPGQQYEVVNRLQQGDQVKIISENGDWLGILAPSHTEAWVPLNQLEHDKMVKNQVSVYSGPGTIFSSYHTLRAGEIVRVSKVVDHQWGQILRSCRPRYARQLHRKGLRHSSKQSSS